ncbi:PQQ-dependent sugar dehydrogenase [Sorangium cellulosum]|nr:PQQ-dependent sugar dehydrogenase [Sorangium cellulosum]
MRQSSIFGAGRWNVALFAPAALAIVACGAACSSPVEVPEDVGAVQQAAALELPAGFQEEIFASGRVEPTAVRFAPDGRVFVAEKSGLIWSYTSVDDPSAPVRVADLRASVHNFWDRGLLGLAVHPRFPAVPHLYVSYALDAFADGTVPRWGTGGATPSTADPCPSPPGSTADGCVVYGRISRIVIDTATLAGTEQPLLSGNWCQQYPSHSTGDLAFGRDGYLYASAGDGASFTFADFGQEGSPVNPCDDPPDGIGGPNSGVDAEGGALRSQDLLSASDPISYDGSVLRIDVSGSGVAVPPDNPLASNGVPGDDFIIAMGLRNPFRIAARPGTDEVWIADVGWNVWEELNRIESPTSSVKNFGWPCFEGTGEQGGYASRALCQRLYAGDYPSILSLQEPYYTYPHWDDVVEGDGCGTGSSSVTGVAFNTSAAFPEAYDGALFFADSSRRCVWTLFAGAGGHPDPSRRAVFVKKTSGRVVDLQMGPDGKLYYVDFDGGNIYRVAYFAGNTPPEARLTASPTSGPAPLTVHLDASGSSDAEDGGALSFAWDLDGDGAFDDATGPTTTATFTTPGRHVVAVRVSDSHGAERVASAAVVTDNSPPVPVIDAPAPGSSWSVNQSVAFSGHALDPEDGELPPEQLSWSLILHHCMTLDDCHEHPITTFEGVASGSFVAPDHDYPTYLELRLTATDLSPAPAALSATTRLELRPETVDLTFATEPPGLGLTVGSESRGAPFTKTVVDGSVVSVSAPRTQVVGGVTYTFASWSDGGDAAHTIVASPSTRAFTARYVDHTCTDGARNGGETGVDCGGGCPPCPCAGATYEAESMFHSTGRALAGGWNISSNGYISAQHDFSAGNAAITVVARGSQALGVWPIMAVSVGGAEIGRVNVTTTSYSAYRFTWPASAGRQEIRVRFTNDLNILLQDRNLYVDRVQITCGG